MQLLNYCPKRLRNVPKNLSNNMNGRHSQECTPMVGETNIKILKISLFQMKNDMRDSEAVLMK